MSFNRFILDLNQTTTGTGVPNENAYLIFYQTDQVTQQTTYSDYLCTVPSTTVPIMYNSTLVNAIQANANGIFPTIFFPDGDTYYYVLLDEDLNTIKTENQVSIPPVSTLASAQFVVFDGNTYIGRSSIEITGTSYTVNTATSWGNIITFNNPNPVAVTIAAPTPSAFPDGWIASFQNIGAGVVTITGGANINGSATLILANGEGADISSDGSIFNAERGGTYALKAVPASSALTVTANTITIGASAQYLIDTSAASQTITTISGGTGSGQIIILRNSSNSFLSTFTSAGNIDIPNSITLTTVEDSITLLWNTALSKWLVINVSPATKIAKYSYTVASGTNGGGTTAGSWQTRPINAEDYDDIGITLSSNAITIPAGTYYISSNQTFYDDSGNTGGTKGKIRNTTDSTDVGFFQTGQSGAAATIANTYLLTMSKTKIIIASPKVFEIQYWVNAAQATNGLGAAFAAPGTVEVYAEWVIEKIS